MFLFKLSQYNYVCTMRGLGKYELCFIKICMHVFSCVLISPARLAELINITFVFVLLNGEKMKNINH